MEECFHGHLKQIDSNSHYSSKNDSKSYEHDNVRANKKPLNSYLYSSFTTEGKKSIRHIRIDDTATLR